jgi:hypothetical protein
MTTAKHFGVRAPLRPRSTPLQQCGVFRRIRLYFATTMTMH